MQDTCPTSTMGQPTLHYNLTAKVTFSGDNRAINKLGMSSKAQSVSNLAELRSKEPSCKHSICRILEAQATDTWYGELGSIEYLPSGTSAPYPPDQKECEWEVPRSKDSACDTCRASNNFALCDDRCSSCPLPSLDMPRGGVVLVGWPKYSSSFPAFLQS